MDYFWGIQISVSFLFFRFSFLILFYLGYISLFQYYMTGVLNCQLYFAVCHTNDYEISQRKEGFGQRHGLHNLHCYLFIG